MRHTILIKISGAACFFAVFLLSGCGPPLRIIPSFEGQVTDRTTGKPVANAVIELTYHKARASFGGDVGTPARTKLGATDAEGRYSIPSIYFVHLLSYYNFIELRVNHPVYETRMLIWWLDEYKALMRGERQWKNGRDIWNVKGAYQDGMVRFDISVLKLSDKFTYETIEDPPWVVQLKKGMQNDGVYRDLGSEFAFEGDRYVIKARKLGVPIDREAIFRAWDEIAGPFAYKSSVKSSLSEGEKRILKVLPEAASDPFSDKIWDRYDYPVDTAGWEGTDWHTAQTIVKEEGTAYQMYLYRFMKKGRPAYVGWFDCFNVRECSAMRINTGVKLDFDKETKQVKITKALPEHQSGITAFESEMKTTREGKVTIFLREVPVFVEAE